MPSNIALTVANMASNGADNADAQVGGDATWADNEWAGNGDADGPNVESGDQEDEYSAIQTGPTSDDSEDAADMDEDSAEYDPESVEITTTAYNPESVIAAPAVAVSEERSASAASSRPTKKPKTAGGFIVGSSDDEDDAPTPPKPAPTNTQSGASRAFTHSPLRQATPAQEPNTVQEPTQAANGATFATENSVASGPNTKSRLPTDVLGMLEDRIKEDPKGDIDAWFALIEEQKRRHKVEDTRNTYRRFLEMCPQAVRMKLKLVLHMGMLY